MKKWNNLTKEGLVIMEELDLKTLFMIFWNKKVQILLIIIIFIMIGAVYSYGFVTPKYKSYTTILLARVNSQNKEQTESITQTDVNLNSQLVSTYSELIKSKTVLRNVISNLSNLEIDEEELRKNITVSSVKETEIIEITVVDVDPNYATAIANEIADVFSEKIIEIYNISNVTIVDEAEVSENPYNINHVRDLIIFAFIGVVIASIYVLIDNLVDNTVKTEQDIEQKLGLFVLASIPESGFDR